jgi:hypothetical protein
MMEANYEYETNSDTDGGSPHILRLQEYWTMLSGATGQLYGNHYTWTFTRGWQSHLNSPGVTQLEYMANLFGSRAWYQLVPDQTHVFVTGGYGNFASSGLIAGNNYVASAVTPDGSLGMAYLPQGGTITVAMTRLGSTVSARWFDPSANTFTAIAGSPFSNTGTQNFTSPGHNSAGDKDWVLVLQTGPKITSAGFSGNDFVVAFDTILGQNYELQNAFLSPAFSWSAVVTGIPGTGSNVQIWHTNAMNQSQQFYRVKSEM